MTEKRLPSLGVIGVGFIGSAVVETFQHYVDVKSYDVRPGLGTHDYVDVIAQDVLVAALPTPMLKDGSVDVSIVEAELDKLAENLRPGTIKPLLIKSTLPPHKLGPLMLRHDDLLVIHNPEFLTERSAKYDYAQSSRFIFGTLVGDDASPECRMVSELFNTRFPSVPQYWVPFAASSLVKYFTNLFFATKVSLMNEFRQVAESWGQDAANVISLVMLDPRIGRSHFQSPGHDGKYGYGGSCFIKDTGGYLEIAKECGVDPTIARATWQKNLEVRGVLTLTEELNGMKGRAAAGEFSVQDVLELGRK